MELPSLLVRHLPQPLGNVKVFFFQTDAAQAK